MDGPKMGLGQPFANMDEFDKILSPYFGSGWIWTNIKYVSIILRPDPAHEHL